MKRNVILLTLGLGLLLSACAPSYDRLRTYDMVMAMEQSGATMEIPSHADEISAFKRYGYERKAAKLEKRDFKHAEMLSRGLESFHFCPVNLVWDYAWTQAQAQNGSAFAFSIVKVQNYQHDQMQEEFALAVSRVDGQPLPNSFPNQIIIGQSLSASSLRFAFRQLDRQLTSLYGKASDALVQGNK